MIGKILSEASHSIIGMLSARPADMETRTANNEFSSLLLSGENRTRPASGNAAAALKSGALKDGVKDGLKDHSAKPDVEQFLNQMIGSDDVSLAPLGEVNPAKSIGLTLSAQKTTTENGAVGNVEVEATPSPVPVPAHSTQIVSALQPLASEYANAGDETQTKATMILGSPKQGSEQSGAKVDAKQVPNLPTQTKTLATPAFDAGKKAPVLDTARSASTTPVPVAPVANEQISKEARKAAVAAKPIDAETTDNISPAVQKTEKTTVPARQMQDMFGLRMGATRKTENAAPQQSLEAKARNIAPVASKPILAESKPFLAEMKEIQATGDPERNMEMPAPLPTAPLASAQNAAQNPVTKTVSFDWNAPQFAERFANELSDLNISGDLKKFEINPRNMGRLEVSFVSRGGVETIRIEAESDAAREVIVQHSQAIQDLLKANGRADLNLRVDVRENMLAASDNGGLNPGQHNSGNEREGEAAGTPNRTTAQTEALRGDSDPGQQGSSDNSLYA